MFCSVVVGGGNDVFFPARKAVNELWRVVTSGQGSSPSI